jgi:plastocyanin
VRSVLVIVGAGLALLACADIFSVGGGDDATVNTTEIGVIDNSFDPSVDTVSAGVTVTWHWGLNQNVHNLTWDTGPTIPPASGDMTSGTYQRTFEAGTYTYHCTYHGTVSGNPMVGTLVVLPAP